MSPFSRFYSVLGAEPFRYNNYYIESVRMEDAEAIRTWRNEQISALRQEQTLAKTIKDSVLKEKIMTKEEVYRFVMHYERLTHYILEEIPKFSDIVLERDEQFLFSIKKR